MTCFKKLWALLLAAGMALTLFAGCCSPSLLRLLLDLLQDQYQNITVTAEDDLETALRQAVSQNDTMEEITAALAQTLDKTVEFQSLRSARAGDQTFSLVFQTGSDTEAIARQTYTDWNKVLGSLPSSGQYLADLATLKADGGYYILVNVTVKRGGSSGSSDDGSGSGDENDGGGTTNPDEDKKSGYVRDSKGDYLIYDDKGLQDVFFNEESAKLDKQLKIDRNKNFEYITIRLREGIYTVTQQFEMFEGFLTSEEPNKPATIMVEGLSLFKSVGNYSGVNDSSRYFCGVSDINFRVTKTIEGIVLKKSLPPWYKSFDAGAIAGESHGRISNCHVTFDPGVGIEVTVNAPSDIVAIYAGGIVGGYASGSNLENCTVSGGYITVNINGCGTFLEACVGGIVGKNTFSIVEKCEAINGGKITVSIQDAVVIENLTGRGNVVGVGGAVGWTTTTIENCTPSNDGISVTYKGKTYAPTGNIGTPDDLISVGNEIGFEEK